MGHSTFSPTTVNTWRRKAAERSGAGRSPHLVGRWRFLFNRVHPRGPQDEVRTKPRIRTLTLASCFSHLLAV